MFDVISGSTSFLENLEFIYFLFFFFCFFFVFHFKTTTIKFSYFQIDFQLSFYGSLGFDVSYLLNTSVQLKVLQQHRIELIDAYANTLIKTLEALAYPQELQPNKEQIQQEIYEREAYGFFVAFAFFPLMSMYANDSHDNSLENLKDEKFAEQKIQLMFTSNKRTIETLKFNIKRLEQLGLL